jgi:type 1 fimbria pilin
MLKVFLFSLLLLSQAAIEQDFQRLYVGTINGKYPITMLIQKNGFSITGTYQYDRIGTDLYLAGSITTDGTVDMKEFTAEGKHTGTFLGKASSSTFTGVWKSSDGKKTLPFSLKIKQTDAEKVKELEKVVEELMIQIDKPDKKN